MKYLLALIVLAIATPASAELIFFSEQRSMSVAGHRFEGDRIIVSLRGGGEMTFDRSLVTSITADEVPYIDETTTTSNEVGLQGVARSRLIEKTSYDAIIASAMRANRYFISSSAAARRRGIPARRARVDPCSRRL